MTSIYQYGMIPQYVDFQFEKNVCWDEVSSIIGKKFNFNKDSIHHNEETCEFGTIRGMYFQLAPYSQSIIAIVAEGKLLVIVVDIKNNSPSFGKIFDFELDSKGTSTLFIPKGFAYGFSVLSDRAIIRTVFDAPHNLEASRGVNFKDPTLGIDWKVKNDSIKILPKDNILPFFNTVETNLYYGTDH